MNYHRACFRFGQAKLGYSGLVGLEPIFATAPAASKNDAHFKSGQKWLKK